MVYCEFKAGQTISQMLGENASHSLQVTIGGVPVPRSLWGKVRPKAGQRVYVTMFPQGGGSGRKWIRAIAMIIVVVVAVIFQQYELIPGIVTWGTAIGIVGFAAINALLPPPSPKGLGGADSDPFEQLNSLTGTSNKAAPYGVIPCVVGQKRFFPPHAAMPYTEINGEDQYLRMLLDLGYGNLDISDIRIGETDLASYEEVEWEITKNPTLFTQDIYEAQVGVSLEETNDSAQRTTQSGTTEISCDIIFNQGLFGVNKKGKNVTGTVTFSVQYRKVGASSWSSIGSASGLTFSGGFRSQGGANISVSSSKRKTLRGGFRFTVDEGQYEVAITRGPATFDGASDEGKVSAAAWSVIRSISPQNASDSGTLKLAVRIRATDQLNGVVQNLSVLAAQKIRRWDAGEGKWMDPVATLNPAWIYLWLLTECPAVVRRLPDDRVDIAYSIALWADDCEQRGLKTGFVLDSGRALGDILSDVLAAGRATRTIRNGKYAVARDELQVVPRQVFTPANSWNFSYSKNFTAPPHALKVKFTNPEASYQEDTRVVYWDGYNEDGSGGLTAATRFEELDMRMVPDADAVWVLARYHLACMWYRSVVYSFETDIEHFICERGDLVEVSYNVIGLGHSSGRVVAVNGKTITLDAAPDFESGKSYAFQVRGASAGIVTKDITSHSDNEVTLVEAIPDIEPGDLFLTGEKNKVTRNVIITKITPDNELNAEITAVDADARVWTADSGTIPDWVSQITGKPWCAPPKLPVVHIRAGNSAPNDAGVIDPEAGVSNGNSGSGIYRFPDNVGGGGCPHVDTPVLLYDGTVKLAKDVVVGDILMTADPETLEMGHREVLYSETKLMPCVEIETNNRKLVCSTSAPIPTREDGLKTAPNVAGKEIGTLEGWHQVKKLRGRGTMLVQHIDIGGSCFWCNGILHHNKKAALGPRNDLGRRSSNNVLM